MRILKARRAAVKGAMTRIANFANAISDSVSSEDCQLRLDRLETAWSTYQEIQDAMLEKSDDPESLADDPDLVECENKYFELKSILLTKIKSPSLDKGNFNQSGVNQNFQQFAKQQTELMEKISADSTKRVEQQVPKINIQKFTGEFSEWITFHDLYVSSVLNNSNLTSSEKFHYLKSFLDGEAAGLLKHTLISESNYLTAWEKLVTRYDKKGLIASNLVKKFVSLSTVSSINSLRKLSDQADELLRGLKALGDGAESRDVFLIHILSNKLDADTLQKWADMTRDEDFPSIKQFLSFLDKRCDSLEVCQDLTKVRANLKPRVIKSFHVSAERSNCVKCKQQHELAHCPQFLSLDVNSRRSFVKEGSVCFNCLRSGHKSLNCNSKFRCRQCNGRHRTLVHQSPVVESSSCNQSPNISHSTSNHLSSFHNRVSFSTSTASNLLPTAIVLIPDSIGQLQACRVLLDSGSQASFISESCVQRLGLYRQYARLSLNGVSGTHVGCTRGRISTQLFSRFGQNSIHVTAYILSKLSDPLPNQSFDFVFNNNISHIEERIADPKFNIRAPVDLILGIDYVFHVIESAPVRTQRGFPNAILTTFGWVFGGNLVATYDTTVPFLSTVALHADVGVEMQKFWEIEENIASIETHISNSYEQIEKHFSSTHSRSSDGKFVVELPFRSNQSVDYGNTYSAALRRLLSNERRFVKDPVLKTRYCAFMSEYIKLGHMEEIAAGEIDKSNTSVYYLPHHPVFKEDSTTTKMRVVFDGSYKASSYPSLNETLVIGPPIQRDLLAVLLRFRRHTYTISGDIEKMFRQIWVARKHVDFQRILWRESSSQPVKHYRLLTVSYGTSCAPYLSVRTLRQLAIDSWKESPETSEILQNDFYVDDLLTGADTVEGLFKVHQNATRLLEAAGFNLRKWSSNCSEFLESLPDDAREHSSFEREFYASVKLLGLLWNPVKDSFQFKVALPERPACTKREILSDTSRIFDPLGFLAPSVIALKIIFQQLWISKLSWDDAVPVEIAKEWFNIRSEIPLMQGLEIPRRIWYSSSVEYHGFCDSSLKAYSAVIYCKSQNSDGSFVTSLVAAKSRVAPIKKLTIPRLELCGALLLCRLFAKLKTSLQDESVQIHAWTDSQIVLHWLSGHPARWSVFIANRVTEIVSLIPRPRWNYVCSKFNPADCASRGIRPSKLKDFHLRWKGPPWLSESSNNWPNYEDTTSDTDFPEPMLELRRGASISVLLTACHLEEQFLDSVVSRLSSFVKAIRILSFCFRFANNCRLSPCARNLGSLSTSELQHARTYLFKTVQRIFFWKEISLLSQGQPLLPRSRILSLMPFIDSCGLLRVGGRIQRSALTSSAKHPIILPRAHAVVLLLSRYYHEKYLHVGVAELFSLLRQEYWIVGCRSLIRKIVFNCVVCAKVRKSTCSQLMGSLPAERVNFAYPFARVGVDFAGPITLRLTRGRRPTFVKSYISLFVCFVTKAIHLELVGGLSTEAFLAALDRFIARRGKPVEIFSDNGTNFKGAYRKLTEMHSVLLAEHQGDIVADHLSTEGISWRFIPPSSPHFGGLWEAGVRSVKLHLKRVIGDHILTYEEFYTFLTRVEALLNSRPLCARADDDFDALTPSHFLIGRPFTSISEPHMNDFNPNLLSNYQRLQHLVQGFWKRWHNEYLTSLQNRPKWKQLKRNIEPGDVVVLKEPNMPQSKWILGVVQDSTPGRDGCTRVVSVKTAHGEFVRPITKLVHLPVLKD